MKYVTELVDKNAGTLKCVFYKNFDLQSRVVKQQTKKMLHMTENHCLDPQVFDDDINSSYACGYQAWSFYLLVRAFHYKQS